MRKLDITLATLVITGLLTGSTVGVAAQDGTTLRADLVRGVELVTEPVELGVSRVVSDGVRDLSVPLVLDGGEPPPRATRIAAGRGGDVWIFGPDAFFRLGDPGTHEARPWDTVEIDRRGNVWALIEGGRLETFDGAGWDRRARRVLDFALHPDGSVFIATEAPRTENGAEIIGPLRRRDWKAGWTIAPRPSISLDVRSFELRPRKDSDGSYGGVYVNRHGGFNSWTLGESIGTEFGPLIDHGEAVSMGFGPQRHGWFLSRFDGAATLEDGRLVATPQYVVTKGTGDWPGFEIPGTQSVSPAFSEDIAVAPDRSVWLPSDAGLAHFDGQSTWSWYLRDHVIDDIDIAGDGTVWVQAADDERVSTYVIDPEAAMGTE